MLNARMKAKARTHTLTLALTLTLTLTLTPPGERRRAGQPLRRGRRAARGARGVVVALAGHRGDRLRGAARGPRDGGACRVLTPTLTLALTLTLTLTLTR